MKVKSILTKMLYGFMKRYALDFLHEEHYERKQEDLLRKKIRKLRNTKIGKSLGVKNYSSFGKIPLTSYSFYREFFSNPKENDLMYPLDDYMKVITSGTMGKPKTFLISKEFLKDNLQKNGFSFLLLSTHDGEKITYEIGDTAYVNLPGAPYISGAILNLFKRNVLTSGWVNLVPENAERMSYAEKIRYFVRNYEKIDIAYMTVTALLDQVYPQIGKPFHLKGFITLDRMAQVLKEKIKDVTGGYPKVAYGSTETGSCAIPSIEYPGAFMLDWRIAYYEFIPEENIMKPHSPKIEVDWELVPLWDVEVGKRYQLVVTPFKNDLMRYVMPDVFQCISKGDDVLNTDLPVFNFYARSDRVIMLHNFTRISEEEILYVLNKAKVPFVDFTARMETIGTREYLSIYLEPSKEIDVEDLTETLHKEFYDFDKDYRDLTNFFGYVPLKLHLLPRGTFKRYMEGKRGMPKIERIWMKEEWFNRLLRIADSLGHGSS